MIGEQSHHSVSARRQRSGWCINDHLCQSLVCFRLHLCFFFQQPAFIYDHVVWLPFACWLVTWKVILLLETSMTSQKLIKCNGSANQYIWWLLVSRGLVNIVLGYLYFPLVSLRFAYAHFYYSYKTLEHKKILRVLDEYVLWGVCCIRRHTWPSLRLTSRKLPHTLGGHSYHTSSCISLLFRSNKKRNSLAFSKRLRPQYPHHHCAMHEPQRNWWLINKLWQTRKLQKWTRG